MVKKLVISMALAAAALTASSASAATTVVSTGASTPDSSWTVTTPGGSTSTATVVAPVPGWQPPVPGSQWLRSAPNPAPSGIYTFTHLFNLSNIGKVQSLVLTWLADNQVVDVKVNGVSVYGPFATSENVSQFGTVQIASADLATPLFTDGQNKMEWFVYNRVLSGTNNGGLSSTTRITTSVPEPGTWLLMILGLGAVGFAMRRRQAVSVRYNFA
jgi:hypothetical protein